MENIRKRKLLQILLPVFIILVIAGIWVYKNYEKDAEPLSPVDEGDFALVADSLDIEVLTAYGLPIIIDFGADYCAPCRQMAPVLESVHAQMQGKAIIKYVDVVEYSQLTRGYPVQAIPTQVFINPDGSPYLPSDDMEIEFDIYGDKESGEHLHTIHLGGLSEEQLLSILVDMGVEE